MEIKSNNEYVNLSEIIETENGITKLPHNYKTNGKYYFLDYKNVYKKQTINDFVYNCLPLINIFENDVIKKYKSHPNSIVVTWSSETNKDVFQASFIETRKPLVINGFSKILRVKDKNIHPKWLCWYLNFDRKIQKIRESIPYTTRCNMTNNELKSIFIKKISLDEQQEIINIIEPFEKIKNNFIKKINNIQNLIIKVGCISSLKDKMSNLDICFEKGKNISTSKIVDYKTNNLFINVSAINNKPNKYIIDENIKKNVKYGDVILSLDGTVGIVNNFLEGTNGYGYKVFSKEIDNSIIYCSLLNDRNQKIINENSNGSVIKHASNSKNKLVILDIKNNEFLLKKIYSLQILCKKINKITELIISKLINLYVI